MDFTSILSIVLPILGAVWLAWRDLHKDISGLAQRVARIEGILSVRAIEKEPDPA